MKVLTIIFQSPTFAPGKNEIYQGIPWQRTRRKTAAFINYIFQITHFFQCSQRYSVLYFWNTKNLNILFKLSIS